ncbi:hypothetical protein, partial [Prosthecobacter sp.]|uniref:hypothetical protein n=1 Tax=Prosthecobacter sp. TaxID=1965333 RepID=UPI0037CBB221
MESTRFDRSALQDKESWSADFSPQQVAHTEKDFKRASHGKQGDAGGVNAKEECGAWDAGGVLRTQVRAPFAAQLLPCFIQAAIGVVQKFLQITLCLRR